VREVRDAFDASVTLMGALGTLAVLAVLLSAGSRDALARPSAPDGPPSVASPRTQENSPPKSPEQATSKAKGPDHPLDDASLKLRFVGDVIFGRYREGVFGPIVKRNVNPFDRVKHLLEADLTVANLETPVVEQLTRMRPDTKPLRFGAERAMVEKLLPGGINAVSLANNHAADQGWEGLAHTPYILRSVGVAPLGAALLSRDTEHATSTKSTLPKGFRPAPDALRVETLQLRGYRLGFISVTAVMNFSHPEDYPTVPFLRLTEYVPTIAPLLRAARSDHDLLIVLTHWGDEFGDAPGAFQRSIAHRLVEAGADLIVGHHPHVLQEIEFYRGSTIAYSLGNFLFENLSPIPRLSGVLSVDLLSDACERRVRFEPILLRQGSDAIYPTPAPAWAAQQAVDRIVPVGTEPQALGWTTSGDALERRTSSHSCTLAQPGTGGTADAR
jgi:poly-gamma-glutamate synthesis protein (capsule biosynthesis protein)